jgi:lipopolysaccharide/colanic/teichoic acid biosynthesis glycosyltransferase
MSLYRHIVKPLFDRLAAVLLLMLASPVMLAAMAALALANGGRVWFRQQRPGLRGRPFRVWKFKTMSDATDAKGRLLPDVLRLTRTGRWVRKLSLDELPQLLNVLAGDMSIVGPRPLLMEYLPLYNERQRRRHEVLPGITGWAQVHGRNTVPWPQRFEYDVWYVDNQSFALDLKILILSVWKVLRAEGIGSGSSETMEKFCGNPAGASPGNLSD